MSASRFIYRLLLTVLSPALLLLFIWQGKKDGINHFAKQRLGFVPKWPDNQSPPIWFHAASVGEVNGIVPLIKVLCDKHPQQPILLTTNTISGFRNAQRRLPGIAHHFLPFDFQSSVRRFLKRVQPQYLFIMETEIWPNLFKACRHQGIAIDIINGRISHKTLSSPRWVRRLYRDALGDISTIIARSTVDRDAFIALGAPSEKCSILGNIKYAISVSTELPVKIAGIERPTVVVASTRDGEEQTIASAWQQLDAKNHLLVIVPRHPERLIGILKDLATYNVTIRSRDELPTEQTEIYLADTFGELKSFMAHSDLVIMGGSFVAKGGQNLIEPAAMGKAIIVGPHMENFAEETNALLAQRAVIQVNGSDELIVKLSALLNNAQEREKLGQQAEQFVANHSGVIDDYLSFVEKAACI